VVSCLELLLGAIRCSRLEILLWRATGIASGKEPGHGALDGDKGPPPASRTLQVASACERPCCGGAVCSALGRLCLRVEMERCDRIWSWAARVAAARKEQQCGS